MAAYLNLWDLLLLVTCTVAVSVGIYEMAAIRAYNRAMAAHYMKVLEQSVQHLEELVTLQQETNALLRERKAPTGSTLDDDEQPELRAWVAARPGEFDLTG